MKSLKLGAGHNTESFLNAFTHLTSRRGVPEGIISDCGTNCVGTVGEMIECICKLDQNKIQPDASYRCVKWNFTFRFYWLQRYLPLLNRGPNWTEVVKDFKKDDIALALKPNLPRGQWPLGCITETYPGRDGHTRNYQKPVWNANRYETYPHAICVFAGRLRHLAMMMRTERKLLSYGFHWAFWTITLFVWGGGNRQIIIAWRNCFNLG